MRYRLRTLFIILGVASVVAAMVGYRIRARNPFRDFLAGFNYNFGPHVTDPGEVAKLLRERLRELPGHQRTDDEIIRLSDHVFHAGYQKLQQSQVVDRFFYRVQLADKSESRVGIWVYRKVDGQIGATVVVYGADSVPQRNQERFDLYQTYEGLLQTLDLNLIASDIDPP